ncbi:MAG: flagellar basal body P-ring protein FlgI [Nitrospinota bacterium]
MRCSRLKALLLACLLVALLPAAAFAVRVKDIASIRGVRTNQLLGYGLVVGLNQSGDSDDTEFTAQSLTSLLKKLGVNVDPAQVEVENVAAVVVTATLPPFARVGSRIDVTVSSLGDARSLVGGTLLLTPLKAADGEVYAVAQGSISVGGGFAFSGASGSRVTRNHPTVGRIVGGATIEREIPLDFHKRKRLRLALHQPDFTTAKRLSSVINESFGRPMATPIDAGTVDIRVAEGLAESLVEVVAQIEKLEVTPDARARVVLNERTGTIVVGEQVRISTVAVSHGNLNVIISEDSLVSQPRSFAPQGSSTVTVPKTRISVRQEQRRLALLPHSVSIGDVVRGLNAIGVSPRDLIAILQAIKAAGALQAELVII